MAIAFGSGAKDTGRIGLDRCFLFFLFGKSLGKGVETPYGKGFFQPEEWRRVGIERPSPVSAGITKE